MTDTRHQAPDGVTTIKTICLAWVVEQLQGATFLSDDNDPEAQKLFDAVGYGVLEDINVRETPSAAIQGGETEVIEGMYETTQKKTRVYVHFKVVNRAGVDQEPLIDYYFGRIVQVLVMPENFAGPYMMDVLEVGNSVEANGANDPEPGGTIYFDIEYRHAYGNPFNGVA